MSQVTVRSSGNSPLPGTQALLNTSPFSKQRAKDQEGTKALYTRCADVRKQVYLLGILSKVIFVNVYI